MTLQGKNYIGNQFSAQGSDTFQAVNPATGKKVETGFYQATGDEVQKAGDLAGRAFLIYRALSGQKRAEFLEAVADEIEQLGDQLIQRCMEETGLPQTRLTGERGRTCNQLRLFAVVLREGSWVDARIDRAQPDRQPLPKPDIRSMQKALGPVAVFGASNFPLAFSVAGGDTASALAAGCPVVVKAHPAHPGTCELVAGAIITAIKRCDMPEGTFSMLHGTSTEVGMAMVTHPHIKAVGFTGSLAGGKALFDAAARRPEPIPVYAEMGSTNPVFILPGILKEKSAEIVSGLTASVTLGCGQFCTNPGLVCLAPTPDLSSFKSTLAQSFAAAESSVMLTQAIQTAYRAGLENHAQEQSVEILATGKSGGDGYQGIPALMQTTAKTFMKRNDLEEELFGPSTLLITSDADSEVFQIARSLSGHLTATVWADEDDMIKYTELISILELKAGRLIVNGFPTGVEVCHSMIHGGPYPATTDSRSTSVGTSAIRRFTRPVCYQGFPNTKLPDELKNQNPLKILRLIDGEYSTDANI